MEQTNEYSRAVTRQVEGTGFMRHAKNGVLVLCLFVLYCVLLSQALKASAASAFFGALAAVPLTVHLYHRVWPPAISDGERRRSSRRAAPIEAGAVEDKYESSRVGGRD
jgi:hypothetical protein